MKNLSLEKSKAIAKLRNVKDYKYKSQDQLIKILSEPEPKISRAEKNLMNQETDFQSQK